MAELPGQAAILRARVERLEEALRTIANGNVPAGFLDSVDLSNKAAFQERFATWMQETARAALSPDPARAPGEGGDR